MLQIFPRFFEAQPNAFKLLNAPYLVEIRVNTLQSNLSLRHSIMGLGKLISGGAAAVVTTVGATTAVVTNNVPGFVKDAVHTVNTEVDNCFSGGCDPTRSEVQAVAQERIDQASALIGQVKDELNNEDWQKYEEIYSNPMSYQSMRTLWGEFARLSDEHLLDGALSRNFGHVTNKHQSIADLKQQGVLALGLEISHDEYIEATRYAALSVATENPAPILYYFKGLATRSYEQMVDSLEQAMEESYDQSQAQLQSVIDQFSVEYLTTVLVAYVSTGEVPQLSLDASLPSVKVGVLTYSRAERSFFGEVKTPNTHQPYILIKLPTVNVRVDENSGNVSAGDGEQPVVEQPIIEQPIAEQPSETQPAQGQCPEIYSKGSFGGLTGKIAFYNEWDVPVTAVLYHPGNGGIFDRYTVPPEQNLFLGDNVIVGDDWGVCFEPTTSGYVNSLGVIADYNPNWEGSSLFMIQNSRIE